MRRLLTVPLVLALLALGLGLTTPARASTSPARQYFGLAPVGAAGIPRTPQFCSPRVQVQPENIPANVTANKTYPAWGTNLHWGPWTQGTPGLAANFRAVNGHYSGGTTAMVLEWNACKWGWDQNLAKAEAVIESSWVQSTQGDSGCSQGILQVRACGNPPATRNDGWGGYPWTHISTPVAADAQMAYLRACYDGKIGYLGNGVKGNAWACIGSWFSGYNGGDASYINAVKNCYATKCWTKL